MTLRHIRERTSHFPAYLFLAVTLLCGGLSLFLFHHADAGGLLGAAHSYSIAGQPAHPVIADFNNDGNKDVAVSNFVTNVISVTYGTGTGALTIPPGVTIPTPASGVTSMLAYDFNNDGYADLAVSAMGVLQIYDGSTFASGVLPVNSIATSGVFTDMAVGDFNGDTIMDIVVIQNSGVVDILRGTGAFAFVTGAGPFPAIAAINPISLTAVAVGDFDAGSMSNAGLDFAVTDQANNAIYVYIHSVAPLGFSVGPSQVTGTLPVDIVSGDFDLGAPANHGMDLAAINATGNSITVLLGNGNGTFTNPSTSSSPDTILLDPSATRPVGLIAANFDRMNENDAGIDLAVLSHVSGPASVVSILLGDGHGNFVQQLPQTAVGSGATDIVFGDLDSDTYPDIVSANGGAADVSVLLDAAAVLRVTGTTGTYGAGSTVPVWVAFNKDVFVAGAPPVLDLHVGGSTVSVSYSGTSTATDLLFNYVVSSGDTTSGAFLDYTSTSALTGAVEGLFGDPAQLTLRAVGGPNSLAASHIIIDGIAPDETIVSAVDGTSTPVPTGGSTTSASMTFNYSGTDDPSGSGVSGFMCSIDGAPYSSCPGTGGTGSTTYTGLTLGAHTFSVEARDAAMNTDTAPATWTWNIVDGVAPSTTITSAVNGLSVPVMSGGSTTSTSMTFGFSGVDTGGSGMNGFVCDLDGGGFSLCTTSGATGSMTYSSLSIGPHIFSVKARDGAGNLDLSPDAWSWTVTDGVAPDTTISGAVDGFSASIPSAGSTTSSTITFSVSGTDNVGGSGVDSFVCDLDGGGFTTCASSVTSASVLYTGVTVGMHTFSVAAVDALGNTDATPDTWIWTVTAAGDTMAPDTVIDTVVDGSSVLIPNGGSTASTTITFNYSGTDELSGSGMNGFFCELDGGGYSLCNSSGSVGTQMYTLLSAGVHTFAVKSRDTAGNSDSTPATWIVTVTSGVVVSSGGGGGGGGRNSGHSTAPAIMEAAAITTPTTNHTPVYAFSSTESGTILYGGSCTSKNTRAVNGINAVTFENLPDGQYPNCMITVKDDEGDMSNVLVVKSFTITSPLPPETPAASAPAPLPVQEQKSVTPPPAVIQISPEVSVPVPDFAPEPPTQKSVYVPPVPLTKPDFPVSGKPITIERPECPTGTSTSFGSIVVDFFSWSACKVTRPIVHLLSK